MPLKHLSPWLLVGTLLVAGAARAEPPAQGVSVSTGVLYYESFLRPSYLVNTVDAAYSRAMGEQGFWSALHVGGGLRLGLPAERTYFPLEVFARAELRSRLGVWEPAAGVEVGVGRLARLVETIRIPAPGWLAAEEELLGPFYCAFQVAPLRFRLGRFLVTGLELQTGPSAPPLGSVWRHHLGLARVEVAL